MQLFGKEILIKGMKPFHGERKQFGSDYRQFDGTKHRWVATEKNSQGEPEEKKEPRKQTTTPEFKEWFGKSKVVDEDGNPLICYRGSDREAGEDFSWRDLGGNPEAVTGMVFTDSVIDASDFAEWYYESCDNNEVEMKKKGILRNHVPHVTPVYLRIENPYIPEPGELAYSRKKLLEQGYDGVLMKANGDVKNFVIFHPTQAKSAIGNNGDFDPDNRDITKSITLFGKTINFVKSQMNLFGSADAKNVIPKSQRQPHVQVVKPKTTDLSLFDNVREGTTKQFGENDTRRAERTKSGKIRWVNADLDLFNQPKGEHPEKKPETKAEPEPKKEADQATYKRGDKLMYNGEEYSFVYELFGKIKLRDKNGKELNAPADQVTKAGEKKDGVQAQPEKINRLEYIKNTAKEIADDIKERKENVIKHFQYDAKMEFIRKHGLTENTIEDGTFIKLWNEGVLSGFLDNGLDRIAPNLIKDALKNPDKYLTIYNEADNKFMKVKGQIDDEELTKYLKDKLSQLNKNSEQPDLGLEAETEGKDKVQQILDDKQKNRQFKDVNERVAGSRKELATMRKLQASELLNQDSVTQHRLIDKDKVFGEFDINSHKESGDGAGLTYLKYKIHKAITSKPINDDDARKLYVELGSEIMAKIEEAKSFAEIKEIGSQYFDKWRSFRGGDKITYAFDENPTLVERIKEITGKDITEYDNPQAWNKKKKFGISPEDIFGRNFLNQIFGASEATSQVWKDAKSYNEYTEQQVNADYAQYIARASVSLQRMIDGIKIMEGGEVLRHYRTFTALKQLGLINDNGFSPEFKPYYDKSYSKSRKHREFDRKTDATEKGFHEYISDLKANKHNDYESAISKLRSGLIQEADQMPSFEDFKKNHPTQENKWDWVEKETGKKVVNRTDGDTDMKIHDNPTLPHIKRENGREVKDSEVTVDNITKDFGFKSVQLGHYVKDNEAKEHIKHFLGSMKDLGDALNLDIAKMNSEGGISLAFGARGGGGKASAHYEPDAKIINLTKTKGDGSVAHELTHYFDHLLAGMVAPQRDRSHYASHSDFKNIRRSGKETPITNAVKGVMDAIKDGSGMKTKQFEPLKSSDTRYYSSVKSAFETGGVEGAVKFVEDSTRLDKEFAYKYIAKLAGRPINGVVPRTTSEYYDYAKGFKSPYWSRETELMARAFESYVQDKLTEKGMYNNYLVSGNDASKPDAKWEPDSLIRAYPQGEERAKINRAFDRLIDAMREKYGENPVSNEKRVNTLEENKG